MNRRQRILFRMVRRLHPPREVLDEQTLALARDSFKRLAPAKFVPLNSKIFKKLLRQISKSYEKVLADALKAVSPFQEMAKKLVEEFGVKKSKGTAADRFWLRETGERGTTGVGGAAFAGEGVLGHPPTPTTLDRCGSTRSSQAPRRPTDLHRVVRLRHRTQSRGGGR